MPNATGEVTVEDLEAFADAWNRHDLDALMSFIIHNGRLRLRGLSRARSLRDPVSGP